MGSISIDILDRLISEVDEGVIVAAVVSLVRFVLLVGVLVLATFGPTDNKSLKPQSLNFMIHLEISFQRVICVKTTRQLSHLKITIDQISECYNLEWHYNAK